MPSITMRWHVQAWRAPSAGGQQRFSDCGVVAAESVSESDQGRGWLLHGGLSTPVVGPKTIARQDLVLMVSGYGDCIVTGNAGDVNAQSFQRVLAPGKPPD